MELTHASVLATTVSMHHYIDLVHIYTIPLISQPLASHIKVKLELGIDGEAEVTVFQLLSQEGEQCVYHTWQEAIILVSVDHGVHSQSLHGKVQQTTVTHFQKPARKFQ